MNARIDPNDLGTAPGEVIDEKEKRPKFEPMLDQPEEVVLGECFWHGKGSYGYSVKHGGIEKVWFVKGSTQKDLDGYPLGQELLVCLRKKDEKAYPWVEVRQAIFGGNGTEVQSNPTEQRRKLMVDRYTECFADALEVYRRAEGLIPEKPLSIQDVKDIATSFFIQRDRKNW